MTDYWLSKMMFDMQQPEKAAAFKRDLQAFLKDYPMRPALREAVIADDLTKIAPCVNAYLLRFFYTIRGVKDAEFIRRLNELPGQDAQSESLPHG
jgi:Aromatic-ring-opening dioxygenase LigAB, LigA subunit